MTHKALLSQQLLVEVNKRMSISTHDRFGPEHSIFTVQYGSTTDSIKCLNHITNRALIKRFSLNAQQSHDAALSELSGLTGVDPKIFLDTEKIRDQVEDKLDEIREHTEAPVLSELVSPNSIYNVSTDIQDTIAAWRLESLPRPANHEPPYSN
ncbi:hypothetical protein [Phascolarctid gammaherpesvirus 1]|uniref:Uncharacterized protein n=1 Tax=Phascolarctid gammaherpesvirus 1 TaxID=2249313 RepID=A0A3Q8J609_9GAMA|nr:hypothetical protein KM711_gp31 [Phascolarctid gammaherpesvirus 1]AZB49207.1 hypothetical protein [Phascolarctid gammaherpesvirus 1]